MFEKDQRSKEACLPAVSRRATGRQGAAQQRQTATAGNMFPQRRIQTYANA